MMKQLRTCGIFMSACLAFSQGLVAATVNLNPVADTSMMMDVPNNNMGGNTTVAAGGLANNFGNSGPTRAMYRFNLAGQIPAGSTIQSATVSLRVAKSPSLAVSSTFGLHKILTSWNEGVGGQGLSTGQGSLALAGETTWNARMHPATLWGTPGGLAGVDYIAASSSSTTINNVGTYTFPNSTALVADIQSWVDNPSSNFGWMLISASENVARTARRFGTRNSVANDRPVLSVTFQPPPPKLSNIQLTQADFRFTFNATQGKSYAVQRNTDLNDENGWTTFTNFGPVILTPNPQVADPRGPAPHFYRVIEN